MRPRARAGGLTAAAAGLLFLFALADPAAAQLTCRPCTIGVVLDGPWERNDTVREAIETQITALIREPDGVRFPADKRRQAAWTREGSMAAVEALLADPEVDLVLTMGPLASAHAVRRGGLPKPVIATFIPEPVTDGFPYAADGNGDRVSGIANMTYVTFSGSHGTTLSRFHEVAPFRHVTVLVMAELLAAEPSLRTPPALPAGAPFAVSVTAAGNSVATILEGLPADTDAVYVTPLPHLSRAQFDELVDGLIARRLPSFSYWGRTEVERGLLTTVFRDTDFERLGRRVALDIERLLLGESAESLPVELVRSQRLVVNMATARAIGVYPRWAVYTEAELINDRAGRNARQLDLPAVAREAVAASLTLAAAEQSIAASQQAVRQARAVLLPQVSASSAFQTIDRDRAAAGLGAQPQRVWLGSGDVTQLLYSEVARAGVDLSRLTVEAEQDERDERRLDAIQQASVAYLNVLRALTAERIQRDNLNTTRSHLDFAEARRRLGVAGEQEVLRWQSQLATNQRDVIAANAARNQAEIALNRLLVRPLEEPIELADATLDGSGLMTTATRLEPFVQNLEAFRHFRNFMAAEALEASPELRRVDAAIRAQERLTLAARRSLWAPTVSLAGDLTAIGTGGVGSSFSLDVPGFQVPQNGNVNWTVTLAASVPLFSGGRRRAEIAESEILRRKLELERVAAADQVEARVRASVHATGASFAAIQLSADAATAARRNLTLVEDAYTRGAIPIIDVVDAQNASLAADQGAASAVYDYLVDLMNVQRAVGRFDFFMSRTEFDAFLARLRAFFEQAGYIFDGRPGA